MMMRRTLVLLFALPAIAAAQSTHDSTFSDLRPDGNGVAELRTTIRVGFKGQRSSDALRFIADQAKLNITFDPQLPGMRTTLSITAHDRSAAAALLEVAGESRVRVRVSRDGQIVVMALPVGAPSPVVTSKSRGNDSTPVTLSTMHTNAERPERQEFRDKTGLGKVSLTGQEVRAAPVFVEPDVLRAVQTLPGIAARSDYSAAFNVRGGEGDQNLVLIDGYPILNPFHLQGLFSTFIDPAVGRVTVRAGSLPARYGGRLSSVLAVESANATTTSLHGTAEVSLVSSNASLSRTFHGGEGSWMIAARRTYADAAVNLFRRDAVPYHFTDVQGHFETPVGAGLRLAATVYNGVDALARPNGKNEFFAGAWGNRVIGATLSKTFAHGVLGADSLALVQRVSSSKYDIHADAPDVLLRASNGITDVRNGGSATFHGSKWTNEIGYELSSDRISYYANGPTGVGDVIPFDSLEQRIHSLSVYGDALWRPSSSLIVEGGVRADALGAERGSVVSPRLSVKYLLTDNLAVIAGAGRYAQWMNSLGREEQLLQPFQFWATSASRPSLSRDAVAGVEYWMNPSRVFHVEAFEKRYSRLLLPNSMHEFDVPNDEFVPATGTSYGADLLLRQLGAGPFSGWLAYTYAVSTRVSAEGVRFVPTQDRRHDLNVVGSWRAGAYAFGARIHLSSGVPYTPMIGALGRLVYDPTTGRWIADPSDPPAQSLPGGFNSERAPFYHRIDASVRRNGHLRSMSFAPYLSVANLYNAKNPAGYFYGYLGRPERVSFPNLPITPTVGLSIGY